MNKLPATFMLEERERERKGNRNPQFESTFP